MNKGLDVMKQEQLLLAIVIKLNLNTFHRSMTDCFKNSVAFTLTSYISNNNV